MSPDQLDESNGQREATWHFIFHARSLSFQEESSVNSWWEENKTWAWQLCACNVRWTTCAMAWLHFGMVNGWTTTTSVLCIIRFLLYIMMLQQGFCAGSKKRALDCAYTVAVGLFQAKLFRNDCDLSSNRGDVWRAKLKKAMPSVVY